MTCFTWSVVALYTVCIYIYVYIIYICICSHVWHDLSLHSITLVCTTHSYVGFTYGTYFHWHVWHDLFTCVTWLVQMCDMTCRCTASHLSVRLIHICDSHMVHGFIDMCDMTCSHVWHTCCCTTSHNLNERCGTFLIMMQCVKTSCLGAASVIVGQNTATWEQHTATWGHHDWAPYYCHGMASHHSRVTHINVLWHTRKSVICHFHECVMSHVSKGFIHVTPLYGITPFTCHMQKRVMAQLCMCYVMTVFCHTCQGAISNQWYTHESVLRKRSDMTQSYVGHDFIHVCDVTPFKCVWRDSFLHTCHDFIIVTWHIHMCHAHF